MHRAALLAGIVMVMAGTALAQAAPDSARRRYRPPPERWMALDSLSQALGLSAAQRTTITPAFTALNGVLKDAAARRQEIRQRMQGQFTPGQEPTPQMRALMDSVRAELEGFQAEADEWYAAIRTNLTAEQQAKFDALPKPLVTFRRRQ